MTIEDIKSNKGAPQKDYKHTIEDLAYLGLAYPW